MSAGDIVGATRWMQVSPLTMLAQVGAVIGGKGRGCESGCTNPARQLNRPATPGRRREGGAGRGVP
jgi:hypothetical protein